MHGILPGADAWPSPAATTAVDIPAMTTAPALPDPLDELQHWYGNATGRWWAVLPLPDGSARLAEAASRKALAAEVRRILETAR